MPRYIFKLKYGSGAIADETGVALPNREHARHYLPLKGGGEVRSCDWIVVICFAVVVCALSAPAGAIARAKAIARE